MKILANKNKCLIIFGIGLLTIIEMTGCKKLVEIKPPITSVNSENVYIADVTAIAVLNGRYTKIAQSLGGFTGIDGLSVRGGLSADEFTLFGNVTTDRLLAYYKNELSPVTGYGTEFWNIWYNSIYDCNAALEGLSGSNTLSANVKKHLIGEAKFLRAFYHFYLSNIFGDIPIILTTDYTINSFVSRKATEQVLLQVIDDLKSAEELLSPKFLNGSLEEYTGVPERARPSLWAAKALLARVYLYKKDYVNAELKATEVINEPVFALSSLSNVFLRAGLGNKEAIWQIQPILQGWNTEDAKVFIINAPVGNSKPVQLSKNLVDAFELGDKRRTDWVRDTVINNTQVRYVFKYKSATLNNPVNEYLMLFRLAEQYLIRAEARAQLNKLQQAVDDLNVLRNRARALPTAAVLNPLPPLNGMTLSQAQVLEKVFTERRIELFSELGHRWFDLKRSNNIDQVMNDAALVKGGIWESYKQLFPIPSRDIENNRNMVQNIGY